MEEILKKLAEHFGLAAPFAYAALAYGFFFWLDENASDEAKAALARTMSFKNYKDEQVASALVEVFDRIYTYPLLRWRAFFRSLLFTTVVSAIYSFEVVRPAVMRINQGIGMETNWALWPISFLTLLLFNVFTDYLSLFVIRPLLIRSGTKPVIGLALGAVSGVAIVLAANLLRILVFADALTFAEFVRLAVPRGLRLLLLLPVTAVFAWLPLFALGIVIAACDCCFRLVAVVRARHRDRPLIDAFVLDSRKNAVVPKRGERASVKSNWIRSSCCRLPWHSCWAGGLQRFVGGALGAPKSPV